MKAYRIENIRGGVDFGIWFADSAEEAIKMLNTAAGYIGGIVDHEISTEGIDVHEFDLVALGDIAQMANVKTNTAAAWVIRHKDLPAPVAETSGGKVWNRADVIEWIKKTGRL
jgi:hypothetical protein